MIFNEIQDICNIIKYFILENFKIEQFKYEHFPSHFIDNIQYIMIKRDDNIVDIEDFSDFLYAHNFRKNNFEIHFLFEKLDQDQN
jgi:hypothetical protein